MLASRCVGGLVRCAVAGVSYDRPIVGLWSGVLCVLVFVWFYFCWVWVFDFGRRPGCLWGRVFEGSAVACGFVWVDIGQP